MPRKPVLKIVIASTRPGRLGAPIGRWVTSEAVAHGEFTVEVVDLAEIALPMLDEPSLPRLRQYTQQHTRDWSAVIEAADAFVFVFPEYNYGINAPLKNALDYLLLEWQHKPAGLVSYGGVAAGLRAAQMLRQVFASLSVVPLVEAVPIPFVGTHIVDGEFRHTDIHHQAAVTMLDALVRWDKALRPLRSQPEIDDTV